MIYEELFSCAEDVFREFEVSETEQKDVKILYAIYTDEDYSGSATVFFLRDGKFWFVTGGHCSCHGLEGQWEPEEIGMDQVRHYLANGVSPYGVDFSKVERVFSAVMGVDSTELTDSQLMVLLRLAIG